MPGAERDADPEERERHLREVSKKFAVTVREYVDKVFETYGPYLRYREGEVLSYDPNEGVARVVLDPPPLGGAGQASINAKVPTGWSPSQIVGKRVRVVWTPKLGDIPASPYVIDDVLQ